MTEAEPAKHPKPAGHSVAILDSLAFCALTVGGMVRVGAWLQRRSLWYDEAVLALNILGRSMSALMHPLAYNQAGPIGFLWGTRLVSQAAGASELALRAIPLACGMGTLLLVWILARRILGAGPALIAAVLVCASGPLVHYSTQVKQYASDAFITSFLVWLALRVLDEPGAARPWRQLVVGGVLGLFLSQPSVFVLAGIGTALVAEPRVRMTAAWLPRCLKAAGIWVVVFAALYVAFDRGSAANEALTRMWSGTFLYPSAPDFLLRVRRAANAALGEPLSPALAVVPLKGLAVLFLLGVGWLARQRGFSRVALFVGPYVGVVLASTLGMYPVATRLLLFATPLASLTVAAGTKLIVDAAPGGWRTLAYAGLAGVLLAGCLRTLAGWGRAGISIEESRGLIAETNDRRRGEPVYVFNGGIPAWAFYTTAWSAPDTRPLGIVETSAIDATFPPTGDSLPSLRPCDASRAEVFGLATGTTWDVSRGWASEDPPAGWAKEEVRRIRTAASPYVWLFAAHYQESVIEALLDEIARQGGTVQFRQAAKGAAIYRLEFPSPGTPVASWACVD